MHHCKTRSRLSVKSGGRPPTRMLLAWLIVYVLIGLISRNLFNANSKWVLAAHQDRELQIFISLWMKNQWPVPYFVTSCFYTPWAQVVPPRFVISLFSGEQWVCAEKLSSSSLCWILNSEGLVHLVIIICDLIHGVLIWVGLKAKLIPLVEHFVRLLLVTSALMWVNFASIARSVLDLIWSLVLECMLLGQKLLTTQHQIQADILQLSVLFYNSCIALSNLCNQWSTFQSVVTDVVENVDASCSDMI